MRKHILVKNEIDSYLNASYNIFESKNLLFEIFEGDMNIENLRSFHQYQINDKSFHDSLYTLSDLREVDIRMNFYEVPLFVDYFNTTHSGKNKKIALVLNSYNYQVLSTLLATNTQKLDVEVRLFKSIKSALKYLGQESLKNSLNSIIEETREEYQLVS